ncbi:MAG: hypothetical protein ACI4O9_03395 [Akkermansia sp.]
MSSKGRKVSVGGLSRELAVALEGSVEAAKDAAVMEAEAARKAAEAARDEAKLAAALAQTARDEAAVFADAVDVRARLLKREVLRISLLVAGAVLAADALVAFVVCRLCLRC